MLTIYEPTVLTVNMALGSTLHKHKSIEERRRKQTEVKTEFILMKIDTI